MLDTIQNSGLSVKNQDFVVEKIVKNISDNVKDNALSGSKIKNIETEFTRLEKQFVPKGGFEGEIGLVFKQLKNQFKDAIELQNPNTELQKINSVYRNIGPVADAMAQASVKEGVFTPAQLLRSLKKADKTKEKTIFKTRNTFTKIGTISRRCIRWCFSRFSHSIKISCCWCF